jgi:hypothetical protein
MKRILVLKTAPPAEVTSCASRRRIGVPSSGWRHALWWTRARPFTCRCPAGSRPMHPDVPCLMARSFCNWWTHEQHVIDGRCEHCGTAVPIVALSHEDLAIERAKVRHSTTDAGLEAPRPTLLDSNVKEMLIGGSPSATATASKENRGG